MDEKDITLPSVILDALALYVKSFMKNINKKSLSRM